MAHEFETGMFVGQPAWHSLGVVLKDPPSIEDAIRMAGLDWRVRLAPLQLKEDARAVRHMASIRESDNSILGVVGPSWRPLQNADAFKWFAPFVAAGEAQIEAAGSLQEGRKVWVLAKVTGSATEIVKGDQIDQYVLLAHAHDGSLAVRIGFTAVRVVCMNTLSAAISDTTSGKLIRVAHRESTVASLEKIRATMDLARSEFNATAEQLRELARKPCDELQLKRYVREVFEPGQADNDGAARRTVAQIIPLFEAGRGAELSRGTLWGAYNAVTEFATHVQGRTADARVNSQWFGPGKKIIDRALTVGMEFAKAA